MAKTLRKAGWFLQVLAKADHRRLRGRWGDLPKFNAVERFWVGTPAWMKNVPAGLGARLAEGAADLKAHFDPTPGRSDPGARAKRGW